MAFFETLFLLRHLSFYHLFPHTKCSFLQQNITYAIKLSALTFPSWQGHHEDKQRNRGTTPFPLLLRAKVSFLRLLSYVDKAPNIPISLFYANTNFNQAIPMQNNELNPSPCNHFVNSCKGHSSYAFGKEAFKNHANNWAYRIRT